jgi:hypothetical protein
MISSKLCATKLQTCLFDYDGRGFSEKERQAYLDYLKDIKKSGCDVKAIMLYTIARPSQQPEAIRLKPIMGDILNDLAEDIRLLGFDVVVNL